MVLSEAKTAPAPEKRISFIVKAAAEWVSVPEYLQLRFQKAKGLSDLEYTQMADGADVIRQLVEESGKTYHMGDDIKFPADPDVFLARLILKDVPLEIYLKAKMGIIKEEKGKIAKAEGFGTRLVGVEYKQDEKLEKRKLEVDKQYNLVNRVAWAAGLGIQDFDH